MRRSWSTEAGELAARRGPSERKKGPTGWVRIGLLGGKERQPTFCHVLHPVVWNAPSRGLIVTVVWPVVAPLAMIALKSPLVSFNRAQ